MRVRTLPCPMCGEHSTVEVEEVDFNRWRSGEMIQNVWPEMRPEERELLITGTHPWCWDDMWREVEE